MEWQDAKLVKLIPPSPDGLAWRYPRRFVKFLAKIEPQADGCWLWTGTTTNGYGNFMLVEEGERRAHRASYLFFKGILAGEVIRHSCHNRSCVHPNHLVPGSQAENVWDTISLGRQHRPVPNGRSSARLNEDDVRKIRGIILMEPWRSLHDIGMKFGVTKETVHQIKQGRNWAHVEGHILPPPQPKLVRRV